MEIIRDHAHSDPSLHSVIAFVEAGSKSMSALENTDAALTAGPPFLSLLEPPLLLFLFTVGASRVAARDANPFDTFLMRRGFVFG